MKETTTNETMENYEAFISTKTHFGGDCGFDPTFMPEQAFPFQSALIEWNCRKGRSATMADCGLGKTLIQLSWARNVAANTGGRVLVLSPLAVSQQTVSEGVKFGIEVERSREGELPSQIVTTNYERLHHFNPGDFQGVVCDESSILKNFDGKIKAAVTDFCRKIPFRLLATATPAPNDYIELGTSSEALGVMGYMDMLKRFFVSDNNTYAQGGSGGVRARRSAKNAFGTKFRFRGHAQRDFWRWVVSWSRALRKPSDMGFEDNGFILPELTTREHVVSARESRPDMLFDLPAIGLQEQREERRRSLTERCEKAAEIASSSEDAIVCWVYLNDEGDTLERMIDGAVQVKGGDSDDRKEEVFQAFAAGEIKRLVTKPTIAAHGLNWQHCHRQTFFPSHSFEQWYQSVRRSWRFGQTQPVTVDVIASEGEAGVLANLRRKEKQSEQMFAQLVDLMNDELLIQRNNKRTNKEEIPAWL